ncbi:HD domain-containing protein [Rhodobacter sp. KR11]|uniref:HD domain-containing protein n=1 Tax=Rhodobacter sp. KR11 TaxID=2974588 RepID=UPI00222245B8|nr:HD domain-containing protein [Rhodobacter sp. KR11]MCW1917987.1 HD domain-containing protein [Rhodobacter sp. KR11]
MLIEKAKAFAEVAHEGQFRKGAAREPYVTHLAEVAALTAEFGGSPEAIAAAWLHDTVEDCDVLPAQIEALFGPDVALMVAQLTDDKTVDKAERKRLQVVNAPHKVPGAALVKLCDKISNVGALASSPPEDWPRARRLTYVDWAETVVQALPGLPAPGLHRFAAVARAARQANAT